VKHVLNEKTTTNTRKKILSITVWLQTIGYNNPTEAVEQLNQNTFNKQTNDTRETDQRNAQQGLKGIPQTSRFTSHHTKWQQTRLLSSEKNTHKRAVVHGLLVRSSPIGTARFNSSIQFTRSFGE
jgi:hypothetical protein